MRDEKTYIVGESPSCVLKSPIKNEEYRKLSSENKKQNITIDESLLNPNLDKTSQVMSSSTLEISTNIIE